MDKITSISRLSKFKSWPVWIVTGILLLFLQVTVLLISSCFEYGSEMTSRPVIPLVIIEISAGVIFLFTAWTLRNVPCTRGILLWIISVGFLLRLATLWSTPVLEDDFYRYLLDGGMSANLFNPYSYSPEELQEFDEPGSHLPPGLKKLAEEGREIISRVNYPEIRTIYPPVAQAFFAVSYLCKPWSLIAWRFVLLFMDITVLVMLICILKEYQLPLVYITFYWWNPLFLKEIFNSAHLEVITFPFVIMSLFLAGRKFHKWSVFSLALAVGTKIWPILLFPLVMRPIFSRPKKCLVCTLLFSLLLGILAVPVVQSSLDSSSGFIAYGKTWEMNDSFFMLFLWCIRYIQNMVDWPGFDAQFVTRIVVGLLVLLWTAWIVRSPVKESKDFFKRALLITGFMFLLSPTQFPWYYIWIVPFLAIQPRFSFLLLTVLLPIYYLRFYFKGQNNVDLFDYWIVWLEFLPVLPFFLYDFTKSNNFIYKVSRTGKNKDPAHT